jgi:hypothetical protein
LAFSSWLSLLLATKSNNEKDFELIWALLYLVLHYVTYMSILRISIT